MSRRTSWTSRRSPGGSGWPWRWPSRRGSGWAWPLSPSAPPFWLRSCSTLVRTGFNELTGVRYLKPGPNGSRCHTGDSICLDHGHTWGYPAEGADSAVPTGCRAPDTTHGTPGRGPERADRGAPPKPMSRARPSVRSRPPRWRHSPSRDPPPDPAWPVCPGRRAEPTRRTTPGGGPVPGPARPSDPLAVLEPVPRVAGTPRLRGTGRGEPAARDRPRDGRRRVDQPRVLRVLSHIMG